MILLRKIFQPEFSSLSIFLFKLRLYIKFAYPQKAPINSNNRFAILLDLR